MKYLFTMSILYDLETPEEAEAMRATMEADAFEVARSAATQTLDELGATPEERAAAELHVSMAMNILGVSVGEVPDRMLFEA